MRRSLLTAGLIILGTVAIAPKTMAQTVDVPFTGAINYTCSFGTPTPGTLVGSSSQSTTSTMMASGGFGGSSNYIGGVVGKVSVNCNSSARLSVSAPVQTGGPTSTPISGSVAAVRANSTTITTSGNSPLLLSTGFNSLDVDAAIDNKGVPLLPGVYSYKVTLTVVP